MADSNGLDRLKAALKQNRPENFYVFHGPEAYLRAYYLNQLRRLVVDEAAEAFNYHRFNPETISLQAVADSLDAIPMLAERSMIQIDDVNFFAMGDDAKDYAKLFSNVPDYCVLVLVYDTVEFRIDKRKKALAEAFERASVVEFTQPTERELTTWIGRYLKKQGKRITVDDAQYLIRRTGGDMTTLLSELEKLCAYVQTDTVARDHIDLLVEPVLEAAAFDLADAIAAGRPETAVEKLRILLQMQQEPILILGAVGSQMRRILTAKRLQAAGKRQLELMKLCGIPSYPAQKTMEFAARLPETFCASAAELCLEADVQMKTSYDDPERILELLVLRLAGEARRG